ncbi:MAG: hypothetical protein NTU81_01805 [Candidatus Nomurabacteria bacterium]|nr:hypothetical protein [Candidatus Nomurabacteria bacterium]
MTEKKLKAKNNIYTRGEINFGIEILIFVVIIFILWILAGGAKKEAPSSPILVPETVHILPKTNSGYGPNN